MIPFNEPYLTGKEESTVGTAIKLMHQSGNGVYTSKCQELLANELDSKQVFLTQSGTVALEMSALLSSLDRDDEVIVASYTFVSTALAFVREKASIIFADSLPNHPNVDPDSIEAFITAKTKAIIVMHYGGVACDMTRILDLAKRNNLLVIEDAAHCIDASLNGAYLGTIGDIGAFSFHESKNIHCGEGGAISINNSDLIARAEMIWNLGTNRAEFYRGEVSEYSWVETGSSFFPSEITAAFLYAQLSEISSITNRRLEIWNNYNHQLAGLKGIGVELPIIPEGAAHNGHIYFLILPSREMRDHLIRHCSENDIKLSFHYQALHKTPYSKQNLPSEASKELPNCMRFQETLVRLPIFHNLSNNDVDRVCETIIEFMKQYR
jgi:dTDP-4-amino-4,6-dideoxygalactose transaminase